MALTEKQLARRRHSLGGSDIAVLLGHSRRSVYDLWMEKKHGLTTFDGNDATEYGTVVEAGVADWAAEKLGVRIRKNVFRADPKDPFHANLDAVVIDRAEAIEVKSTGYKVDELWKEPGTDEVPHHVVCQCQWQAARADLDRVHVAAALTPSYGSNRLRLYCVERHDALIERLEDIGRDFWRRFVEGDEIPEDLPSMETIKAVVRVPNFEKKIDRDLVAELIQAKRDARDANAIVKDLTKQLHAALYDPDTGTWAEVGLIDDEHKVTYYEHERKPYEVKGGHYRRLQLPRSL